MSNSSVILRASAICLALALLAAIVYCVLRPSSHMREVWFIPTWLGEWADRNPTFRNFPAFAALAVLLFLSVTFYQPLVTSYGRWRLALGVFVATALLGILLEALQLLFLANRHFDWADIGWSTSGAFIGTAVAAACFRILTH